MKKITGTVMIIILLMTFNASAAYAEEYLPEHYEYAVRLNMLGLFRGTDTGFELERQPTRLEGAVMFVRMLGAEEEALEQRYPHPFTDVPQWGDPYVGYLYSNELTNGISLNEFGSYIPIKAISYVTFALRALGYSDSGSERDFEWDSSVSFAYENGIIDFGEYFELATEVFLRGHVAMISYGILDAVQKESDISLIDMLIDNGAVDISIAGALGLITDYDAVEKKIAIGDPLSHVLEMNGNPGELLESRYGFGWLTYDSGDRGYVQIGVENDEVVGILAVSNGFSYENNAAIGMMKSDLESLYDIDPLTELRKPLPGTNTIYVYDLNYEDVSIYLSGDGNYITYYFDSYENDVITAILVIDKAVEDSTIYDYPDGVGPNFFESIEVQVFRLTNAFRIQKGLGELTWSTGARKAASLHSKDMAERKYFSHVTPEGATLGDRLVDQGINYIYAGENIAYGYRDPIHMVNDWLNSKTGHRETMLGNFNYLGIGIWIDENDRMFGTQDYWR